MKRLLLILVPVLLIVVFLWSHLTEPADRILLPSPVAYPDLQLIRAGSTQAPQTILVVFDLRDANVYARYVTEILRAEGIFTFESIDLSVRGLDSLTLWRYSLVITCTQDSIICAQRRLLEQYVKMGGSLLSIAPPSAFDSLLGVQSLGRTLEDGLVQFDSTHPITKGVTHAFLQFFGAANVYAATSSTIIAGILEKGHSLATTPGIGVSTIGKGKSAFIAFDLGKSIVFTRQGKPALGREGEGVDSDGDGVFKCSDLFYGTFDYSKRSLPQADELQKVFAHLVIYLLQPTVIVPRVWYFPFQLPSVALLTGDHHGQNWQNEIQRIADYLDRKGGHFTFFVYSDMIDTSLVNDLVRRGHTIAPHLYYPRRSNTIMRARQYLASWFSSTYFFRPRFADLRDEVEYGRHVFSQLDIGSSELTRLHYLIWPGWTEPAQLMAQNGFRMDFSISGVNPRGERRNIEGDEAWNAPSGFGYINGSGRPMRFLTRDGKFVDLFSQLTLFEDDVAARELMPDVPNDSVTTRRLIEASRTLIDESILQYHAALVWNLHPEHVSMRWPPGAATTWPLITSLVDTLVDRNIPLLGADEWLRFVVARNEIRIERVEYDARTKVGSFSVVCPREIDGLTLLLPLPEGTHGFQSVSVANALRINSLARSITFNGISYMAIQLHLEANLPTGVSYRFQ